MSEKKTYRQLRDELDEVMASLHNYDLDIDEAVKQYQQGIKLVKQLEDHLKKAELEIKKVNKSQK